MENFIVNVLRSGNMLNISLNGKLHKKICSTIEEAKELMALCMVAKSNPLPVNIKAIKIALNERTRIAMLCGLEADNDTGEIFLAGFNTPVPEELVDIIKDYHDNGYPLDAIINFWKLLMINPDTRVRKSLFKFVATHDFVITDSGYFIAYKAVIRNPLTKHESPNDDLKNFVTTQWLKIKGQKKSPKNFEVYRKLNSKDFQIINTAKSANWNEKEMGIQFMGNLDMLNNDVVNVLPEIDTVQTYTDKHTQQMHIQLGVPTFQKRSLCDADPANECSKGLHIGSTKYVSSFGNTGDAVLMCYVNPMNVVSVPDYDNSKIRVCEYFPFGEADYDGKKIDIIKTSYYESDYKAYEEESLNRMVENVRDNQLPIEKAINVPDDEIRPMSELLKIIEGRLLDITGN